MPPFTFSACDDVDDNDNDDDDDDEWQVSSWVTHLIVSPPSHDERKAVLSCLIRAAVICWNLGNFHGATEIVVGLR